MSHLSVTLPDGDADENPRLVGHHMDHASAIADGSLVPFEEFDWAGVDSLESISEMPASDSAKLAEALHAILIWLLDRRLMDPKSDQGNEATVDRALRSTAVRCVVLGMVLTPSAIGPRRLREAARLVKVDESYLRRLAGQIQTRFQIENPLLHR